jgi:rare lipoprotein A
MQLTKLSLACLSCLSLLAACGGMPSSSAPARDHGTATETPKPVVKPTVSDGSATDSGAPKRGGGYYKDDGPDDNPPDNLASIPDAVPKDEPLHKFANRPYSVLGRSYTPLRKVGSYKARGLASWYGKKFHGMKTSIGEVYDMYEMTAAHPILPIPSYARVTNLSNGKSVVVRVNDRGPFHSGRIIDLSYTAASKLGYIGKGSTMVEVESLMPGQPLPDMPPTLIASNKEDAVPAKGAEALLPEFDDARGAWLQLGAFGSRDNAEALKSRLMGELGDMKDKLVVRTSGNLFRVQLGPWADAREARGMADKLGDLLEIKPVLVSK